MRLRDYLVKAAQRDRVLMGDTANAIVDDILDELISRVPSIKGDREIEDFLRDVKNGQRW